MHEAGGRRVVKLSWSHQASHARIRSEEPTVTAITIRFADRNDQWRIQCLASSGQCFFWRNGSFVRSTTYVPHRGFSDQEGFAPELVPKLVDCLHRHARRIADVQGLNAR